MVYEHVDGMTQEYEHVAKLTQEYEHVDFTFYDNFGVTRGSLPRRGRSTLTMITTP